MLHPQLDTGGSIGVSGCSKHLIGMSLLFFVAFGPALLDPDHVQLVLRELLFEDLDLADHAYPTDIGICSLFLMRVEGAYVGSG